MKATNSLWALILIAMFTMGSSASATPIPRVLNAGFDLEQLKGVACEWRFQGAGTPVCEDGYQGVEVIPAGQSGLLMQEVPFCVPGDRYTIQATIAKVDGVRIWLGLDPSNGTDEKAIQWNNTLSAEDVVVTATASGTNITLILAFSNEQVETGSAWVDKVDLGSLGRSAEEDSTSQNPLPPGGTEARSILDDGLSLIERDQERLAQEKLEEIINDYPDSREEVAKAMVGMQEVRKLNEMNAREMPLEDQADYLGMEYLRTVYRLYPEQEEACAEARCKQGEFYLARGMLGMARELLDLTMQHYPGFSGAMWARVHSVNERLWSGENGAAADLIDEIEKAYRNGEATQKQKAWAVHFYIAQGLSRVGQLDGTIQRLLAGEVNDASDQYALFGSGLNPMERLMAYYQSVWVKHIEDFPELAIRSKLQIAQHALDVGEYYKAIDTFREIILQHPSDMQWTGSARILLAHLLRSYGWKPEHQSEAIVLLEEVEKSPEVTDSQREVATADLQTFRAGTGLTSVTPEEEANLLANPGFEYPEPKVGEPPFRAAGWRVDGVEPNWFLCDWSEGAPGDGLGVVTPAWNSANGMAPWGLRATLVSEPVRVLEGRIIHASAYGAADGWGVGSATDVLFEIDIRFLDGFLRPLEDLKSGAVQYQSQPKAWQEVKVEGPSPTDACFAELRVSIAFPPDSHHAAAVTEPSLSMREETH